MGNTFFQQTKAVFTLTASSAYFESWLEMLPILNHDSKVQYFGTECVHQKTSRIFDLTVCASQIHVSDFVILELRIWTITILCVFWAKYTRSKYCILNRDSRCASRITIQNHDSKWAQLCRRVTTTASMNASIAIMWILNSRHQENNLKPPACYAILERQIKSFNKWMYH